MFRKYEKTFRIISDRIRVAGKLNLSHDDQKALLNGKVSIEEKMDGANTAIIRGKKGKWTLQKRRGLADTGSHPQFAFFWNWARACEHKILEIPEGWIVYGELMYACHHIYYDQLPSYWLGFDIWDGEKYLPVYERNEFLSMWGFQIVPVLYYGHFDRERIDLDRIVYSGSSYATKSVREGVVIKNAKKQMRAKLVRPEFMKEIEEDDHWMKRSVRKNDLRKGANPYD